MAVRRLIQAAIIAFVLVGCGDSAPPGKVVNGKDLDRQQASLLHDDLPGDHGARPEGGR